MVSKNKPDWLPSGWKVHIKGKNHRKVKCFIHSKTSRKFYSKPEVLRYINGSIGDDNSNATKEHAKKSSEQQEMQLPAGWTVEVRTRQSGTAMGTPYKCYIDPSGGNKFFSKPEVFRYLQSIQNSAGPSPQKESRSTIHSSSKFIKKGSIDDNKTSTTEEDAKSSMEQEQQLPAGWTVEVRTRQSGRKMGTPYKCYIHQPSGSKFFSMPEVFRHLQTIQNSPGPSGRKESRTTRHSSSKPTPAVKQETANCNPKEELLCGEGTSKKCRPSLIPVDTAVNEAGVRRITRSSTLVIPASIGEAKPDSRFASHENPLMIEETSSMAVNVSPQVQDNDGKKILAVSMKGCSNKKDQTTKRQTEDQKFLKESSRSSKRLAGVDVHPVFHSIPLEHVRQATSKKSIGVKPKPVPSLVSVPYEVSEISETPAKRSFSSKKIEVAIENTVDHDLPSGWIKEMRKKVYGTKVRTDPFYFHPSSGLVFRSKVEVLHYLATGEISRHAYRRKSRTGDDTEELGVVKISPTPAVKRETTNSNPREELLSGEETSNKSPSLMPEARVVKETGVRRITRSSTRGPVGEAKPDVRFASHENPLMIEETSSMAVNVSPQVQDNDGKIVAVSMKGCSNKKAQTTKRKAKDKKSQNESSRSSKRLAGIDVQPVFHSIPIEHAHRPTSRKSIGVKPDPVSILLSAPNDLLQDKAKPCSLASSPDDILQDNAEPSSLVSVPNDLLPDKAGPSDSNTQKGPGPVCQSGKDFTLTHRPTRSRKSIGVEPEPVPILLSAPNDLLQDKAEPSSLASSPNDILQDNAEPSSLVSVPNDLLPDKAGSSHSNTQKGPVCQSGKDFTLNVSIGNVIATEEPQHNFDSLVQNVLPVISENVVIDVPSVITEKSLEISRDPQVLQGRSSSFLGSKIEHSLPSYLDQDGQPGSTKDTAQSGSEFSFPPPMWSDPCLEFAYKTLTGAIPLDDNLAIEDYIQHQLRTSKQTNEFQSLPDIDMASFLQNEETKQVPPLPDSIKLPNSNGLTPPQNRQVKG